MSMKVLMKYSLERQNQLWKTISLDYRQVDQYILLKDLQNDRLYFVFSGIGNAHIHERLQRLQHLVWSFSSLLVRNTLGNFSCLIHIHGNVLSSFSKTLYLGRYFLIKLFSNNNASDSFSTITYFKLSILLTRIFVL